MNEDALSTEGITLTEETRRKTYPSVTLCTTDYTRNGLRLNTNFFCDSGEETFRRHLYTEAVTLKNEEKTLAGRY
jgi:hypothetical protein